MSYLLTQYAYRGGELSEILRASEVAAVVANRQCAASYFEIETLVQTPEVLDIAVLTTWSRHISKVDCLTDLRVYPSSGERH
jgi:hypothetical protein